MSARLAVLLCFAFALCHAAALRRAADPKSAAEPFPLSMNRGENGACAVPKENLRTSIAFNPAWWQGKLLGNRTAVTTERDDCRRFVGHGRMCMMELPEQTLARRWLKKGAVVMEFGARFGTTTCEIAKALGNSGALVAVEPDPSVWESLEGNLRENNCRAHVLRGALSTQPVFIPSNTSYVTKAGCSGDIQVPNYSFKDVEQALGQQVDTLLIDCEGCIDDMMDQLGPLIATRINTVIFERDGKANWTDFNATLEAAGLTMVDELNDCKSGKPKGSWCSPRLMSYVFQRPKHG
mmetsp:Transcript_120952/g.353379  ORF Transcript_120952/g.353379 Transcript_120952/m.353379 type:complete len:294 (-) Transcript_120952:49-930(-)